MTTQLEQEFYNTFGIEPEPKYWCKRFDETRIADCNVIKEPSKKCSKCENGYIKYRYYPVITAEKLLRLLCIVIDEYNRNGHTFYLDSTNVKELKEDILDALIGCIDATCDLFETEVKQIQQLFKEAC